MIITTLRTNKNLAFTHFFSNRYLVARWHKSSPIKVWDISESDEQDILSVDGLMVSPLLICRHQSIYRRAAVQRGLRGECFEDGWRKFSACFGSKIFCFCCHYKYLCTNIKWALTPSNCVNKFDIHNWPNTKVWDWSPETQLCETAAEVLLHSRSADGVFEATRMSIVI